MRLLRNGICFLFGFTKCILTRREQKIPKFPGLFFPNTDFTWKELKERRSDTDLRCVVKCNGVWLAN